MKKGSNIFDKLLNHWTFEIACGLAFSGILLAMHEKGRRKGFDEALYAVVNEGELRFHDVSTGKFYHFTGEEVDNV